MYIYICLFIYIYIYLYIFLYKKFFIGKCIKIIYLEIYI